MVAAGESEREGLKCEVVLNDGSIAECSFVYISSIFDDSTLMCNVREIGDCVIC